MINIILLAIIIVGSACKDDLRLSVVQRNVVVTSEVFTHIEVVNDTKGQFEIKPMEGAVTFGARILDTSCATEIKNLGTQTHPEFSMPVDIYFEALCFETTYYNDKGKVIGLTLQPFSLEGPEPLEVVLTESNQILNFLSVDQAVTYSYNIKDSFNHQSLIKSNHIGNVIDFNSSLKVGTYRMIILAHNNEGKNLRAMGYKVRVVPDGPTALSVNNVRFEQRQYQTRSVKRLLIEDTANESLFSLKVAGVDLDSIRIPNYTGAYAALMSVENAFMRGVLPYGAPSVAVNFSGLSEEAVEVPVTVKDFNYFEVLPLGFADGEYSKGGLEIWSSTLQQNSIRSDDHQISSVFGLMIIQ
ncbi:MAG: hypothetical protein M3Q07_05185 [Pseudobdellovibrionaceae bacterium]|nr:hypothetical protein [Pseudobdellovibrionaceae bacterium]